LSAQTTSFSSDTAGLYAARTAKLIELAEAAKASGKSQVAEGEDGVTRVPDLEGIHTLTLSTDELLLAVCVNGHVLLFSTQDLIEKVGIHGKLEQFDPCGQNMVR
jgi:hypothetical protein